MRLPEMDEVKRSHCFKDSELVSQQLQPKLHTIHITNSVIRVSRPPVLDCGTTFHLDYGGRDLPSTISDNLRKLIYLATEALSDSFEFIGALQISLSIYLSIYLSTVPLMTNLILILI